MPSASTASLASSSDATTAAFLRRQRLACSTLPLAFLLLWVTLLSGCVSPSRIFETPAARREREQRHAQTVSRMDQVVKAYLGTRYRMGGVDKRGVDCSGLLVRIYQAVNIKLPHSAAAQYGMGKSVDQDELQYGDILFWNTKDHAKAPFTCLFSTFCPTMDAPLVYGLTHSGMFVGKGRFVHASPSKGVAYARLEDEYWADRYIGARRVLEDFD